MLFDSTSRHEFRAARIRQLHSRTHIFGPQWSVMPDSASTALVKTIPAVLWVVFAALVYLTLRRALIPQFQRLSRLTAPGVELTFAQRLLDEAVTAEPGAHTAAPPASERRAAVSRLEHALEIVRDGRILWVDDHPSSNAALTSLFTRVGMHVDSATSTTEALERLVGKSYDIVITDMRRDTEQPAETAGITLLNAMAARGIRLPVLVFTANFDPAKGVHSGIFACAKSADNAVQYVIDLMERIKFGAAM